MKTARLLGFLAFAVTLSVANTHATTVIPPTFDELVNEAELIFQGTVTDVKSQWAGEGAEHRIVSYVTFRVEDALKGNPGETYTIQMLGGTVDGQTMEVTDAPKFKVGNRDIVFVQNNGSQFIPLVGIMHGRYRVVQDQTTGAEVILDHHGDAISNPQQLGKDERAATEGKAIAPADFKSAIRAKVAASGAQS